MNNTPLSSYMACLDKLLENFNDIDLVTTTLKNVTLILKISTERSSLNESHWQILSKLARIGLSVVNKNICVEVEIHFLAELFRCLRNSCAGCSKNKQFLLELPDVYDFVNKTFAILLSRNTHIDNEEVIVLRCCLQLFGNLVCQAENSIKISVWNIFLEKNAFGLLLQNQDLKVQEYTMMVLYNCLTDDITHQILNSSNGHNILLALTNSLCHDLVDWGVLFLGSVMENRDFMDTCYNLLPVKNRLLILDIIAEQLDNVKEDNLYSVATTSMQSIERLFVESAMNIVQVCNSDAVELKVIEIVKLLSLLCTASVLEQYSNDMKRNKALIEIVIDTLKSVHLLGKQSCNAFSSISSLSATASMSKEDIESSPSYCFKKNLIRLIGNLCYNCKENQDLIRTLDGIPLLLDCSNLDSRNPFIMQWCILAIRNILEKNIKNQEVLASVSLDGDFVDSSLLKELGFEVQNKDGKFVLVSAQNST